MSDKEKLSQDTAGMSRRDFIKSSASLAAMIAASGAAPHLAYAAGSDTIRIGLIGCGGRGSGAVENAINAADGVEIVALGDLFDDRLKGAKEKFKSFGDKNKVTDDNCFSGFDAYKKVLATDINYVILATPPGFRPVHFRAAIEAGKNVFMEKPVAVDPTGVRSIIETADMAAKKNLAVVSGTQRRHSPDYIETIKRIHDGALGDVVAGQVYWNQGGLWNHDRQPGESDMEWQVRNWLYFTWLSGDHIVEQHVHNLDVANWVLGHPERCVGMGGRQARTDPKYGHIFDHFTIDFVYPNNVHVLSMCRQIDGTASNVSERFAGTKGTSNAQSSIRGENNFRYQGKSVDPYTQEHTDNIAAIRAGKPLNEGRRIAESTLTAIMARESAYTGQEITWEQAMNSKLDLMPQKMEFGALEVPPVAVPGRTQFV